MFRELKETMSKELKKIRRMISLQIDNINKYLEIIKKNKI